jgi:UDP-N-acetylmuramoyl-tripeptide--D-alanyl-D-alanine ligase
LFIPLVGERFDGHRFLAGALAAGAAGALVAVPAGQPVAARLAEVGLAQAGAFLVAVPDTLAALQRLAAYYRRRFTLPVVGVTGSVGKTSTKDLIAAVLRTRWRTVATRGNYNNEIGLPLTVFTLEAGTQAACFELGMRGFGQIRELAAIVQPTVGVVTNVGETHLELLGSRENIARAKAELVEALPVDGVAVLNADDPRVAAMAARTRARVVRYGLLPPGELPEARGFTAVTGGQRFSVDLAVPGVHNVANALAAAAVGLALGLDPAAVAQGLAQARLTEMRLQPERGLGGYLVINDAYNASPASVRAALATLLESRTGGEAVAVLGDMLELGEGSAEAHRQVGAHAAALGVDRLLGVGPLSEHTVAGARAAGLRRAESCRTTAEAALVLAETLRPEDVVLVKGSRGMHMEEIVRQLTGAEAGKHA